MLVTGSLVLDFAMVGSQSEAAPTDRYPNLLAGVLTTEHLTAAFGIIDRPDEPVDERYGSPRSGPQG